jgi:hypothetical protein
VIDADNRLVWPLRNVRLMMQPQVHWEPVHVLANDKVLAKDEVVFSTSHGGPTLVGATSVKLVPVLPGLVGDEIVAVANGQRRAAALFGLPFGMHAFAHMEAALRAGRRPSCRSSRCCTSPGSSIVQARCSTRHVSCG